MEKGKTSINITKRESITIDKDGNIIKTVSSEEKDPLKAKQEERAKRLGFKK